MSPLISEKKESSPILIVDKIGTLGTVLATKFAVESTVVLVTKKELSLENILIIPFENKIPKIPNNLYSHIFVIDDEEDITMDFLSSFLNKAREDKAVFCFCTNIKNQEKIPQDILDYKKTKVVFLGDVFPGKDLFSKSYINRFINSSKNRGRINVPQDGMAISYPVFLEDTILAIFEASFGTSQEKIYYALPKHGVTLLTLAHMMQKIDPDIKIDFSDEMVLSQVPMYKDGRYLLDEKYPLEEKLKSLKIKAGKFEKKETDNIGEINKELNLPKFSLINTRLILFTFLFFLFLPLITTLLFTFFGFLMLDLAKTSQADARYFLDSSKTSFILADSFSKSLTYETQSFQIEPINKLLQSIEKGKKEVEGTLDYYNSFDLFSEGKTTDGIASLKNFIIYTESKNPKILGQSLQNFLSQTIDVWPQIFAIGSKKTYLILFQNNLIIRPTGGVIQAFGLLTIKDGKLSDFKIYNTNDSDKNLKGHVEPPFALRRFLPTTNLFMKDSNFNPDFLETAASSSFFVNLEQNQKVDGVIAVDLTFLEKLEKSLGNNGQAFLDSTKSQSQNGNFLGDTVSELVNKLKSKNYFKIFISNDFSDLVENKHILFEFNDPSIENVFASNNFFSTFSDNRDNSPKIINDYLSVIEANLGALISGISRNLSMKTEILENGEISSTVNLKYSNSGETDYKNYLRFIVPGGSTLKGIKIDGNDTNFTDAITDPSVYEASSFQAPKDLEVERSSQSGKNSFGFLITIPKGKTKTVEVSYGFNSVPLSNTSNFSYDLKFFKQPGIDSTPFNFSLLYPEAFRLNGKSSFSKSVDKDFDLNFNFSQK